MNINIYPVKDYRSVDNKRLTASHAVRHATCMLQYGCIPYGMQGTYGMSFYRAIHSYGMFKEIQFSTERYIPTECSMKYNTIFNLSHYLINTFTI